jgi:hypothetical protein
MRPGSTARNLISAELLSHASSGNESNVPFQTNPMEDNQGVLKMQLKVGISYEL